MIDAVSVRPSQYMECVFAVDRRGLWVSQQTFTVGGPQTYGFEALELPGLSNDDCRPPDATTQRITRLAPLGREWLAVSTTGLDGGGQNVGVLDLRPMWARNDPDTFCTTFAGEACLVSDRIPIEWQIKPCAVCAGGQLLDFAVVPGAPGLPNLEVRCGGSDGGTGGFFIVRRRNASADCTS
ncbi:MAG: hypothetical protein H6Q89_5595, partial [Myxococcaceae bacterium]|nr:hypothetical protein [Myxococcaceae bacterium]